MNLDASNLVEFSQAVFRTMHTNVPSTVNLYSVGYVKPTPMDLSDTVDKATMLERNYNKFLRGMLRDPMKTNQIGCSGELRNKFQKNECGFGMDLFATDIMRGRDFGVAPYIDYVQFCAAVTVKKWDDLERFFADENLRLLRRIYSSVKDIDLLVGVLLERKQSGLYGEIGGCIASHQFSRLKLGDRFFYTSSENPYAFSAGNDVDIGDFSQQLTKFLNFFYRQIKFEESDA